MRRNLFIFIALLLVLPVSTFAQEQILFTVEDQEVPLSEFLYIYEKTNRDQADFSEGSVKEYLDLYRKFKLKVQKARDMKLDTIVSLQQELAGYRKQLASTYLNDREVLNNLVTEAHDRMQQDVDFSHILFSVPNGVNAAAEEAIYQEAAAVLDELRNGADFAEMAIKHSKDPSVAKNRGNVGFMTAMMPDGFYELETALYTLPPKTVSRPIRTKRGYHLVKVNARRTARGEVEVRHILIRSGKGKNAKERIDEVHELLEGGADFEEMVANYSEDKKTVAKGGYLGAFGINKYESSFESAAFRLQNDGDYSKPISTSIGWHIIQRISKTPIAALPEIRRQLESEIKRDGRYKVAEMALLDRIRDENDYQSEDWDRELMLSEIGDDFRTYNWKVPEQYTNQKLFSIGTLTNQAEDFLAYLEANTANRLRINRVVSPIDALNELYNQFEESKLMLFEEQQLDQKYPEFKALMREYSEGILLFEATKRRVWDKASQDSVGLQAFYESNKQKYLWPERASIETVTINTTDDKVLAKIMKLLPRKSSQQLIAKFNKKRELIQTNSTTIDKEELDPDMSWKKGSMGEKFIDDKRDRVIVKRVAKIIAPKPKSLGEARGYIIADYQDHLEKAWIEELSNQYEVRVNDDVLNSIIK